jgi:hypothetical protein
MERNNDFNIAEGISAFWLKESILSILIVGALL